MNKFILTLLIFLSVGSASLAQAQSPGPAQPIATGAVAGEAPADVEAFVKAQTKGGDLDYNKLLATRKQSMFLHEGTMFTKKEYALVLWGMRVKSLGVASAERASALYAGIINRPLIAAELKAIKQGFDSGSGEGE